MSSFQIDDESKEQPLQRKQSTLRSNKKPPLSAKSDVKQEDSLQSVTKIVDFTPKEIIHEPEVHKEAIAI